MKSQHSWFLTSCLAGIILLCGCRVVGTDDVLYASILTQQEFDDGYLLSDPNRRVILLCGDRADLEKVNNSTLCGVIQIESVIKDCERNHILMVPSQRNKAKTATGTGAFLKTVCLCCPVFSGSPHIAPRRPRWPTLGDRPADGAVLRPRACLNVGKTCVFCQKTKI